MWAGLGYYRRECFLLEEEVVLAVQRMQVLLGLYMMLFPRALLLAITTCQQTRRHFFWSFLISLSGQMFIFKIMPGLLCHYFGVASRFYAFASEAHMEPTIEVCLDVIVIWVL
ncbi:uncharacterized protein LOC142617968 isoform X2 [Castanea sativa]|uniref:uncharacterized protein LOC142617968 isoform X2 n=1 Tax=Castanea sativa TaxID=21020 RepID=UPI003F64CD42